MTKGTMKAGARIKSLLIENERSRVKGRKHTKAEEDTRGRHKRRGERDEEVP